MRPSAKFDRDPADDPFAKRGLKTNFAYVYKCGRIPCRINHGSVKHKLQWDVDPSHLDFDPLLVILAEGLNECQHPYVFIASRAFEELLESKGALDKTLPLTKKLVFTLRESLRNRNVEVFSRTLDALKQLSKLVGPAIDPYLSSLLVQVNRKGPKYKPFEAKILETIETFARNGGDGAVKAIKLKVPTFVFC
eukprot:CAMPEP_0170190108 /NCGR_PEP_ID=MMETSP0040_2-20121228/48627_1 /TAXON_ID=641309 /ORGANISM="Lotharella oceanica, Strain CCMP622" /LENGTH=192 /DNA_ID=CAMNT_0010437903 /DNA_START=35 /DNA_END=613 /DNA_ORIENTATION=-